MCPATLAGHWEKQCPLMFYLHSKYHWTQCMLIWLWGTCPSVLVGHIGLLFNLGRILHCPSVVPATRLTTYLHRHLLDPQSFSIRLQIVPHNLSKILEYAPQPQQDIGKCSTHLAGCRNMSQKSSRTMGCSPQQKLKLSRWYPRDEYYETWARNLHNPIIDDIKNKRVLDTLSVILEGWDC